MLITIENCRKYHNDKCILEDASFSISEKDKLALIGINGMGKTTFLKMVAGLESMDSGNVIKKSNLVIGYLPQNVEFEEDDTILTYILKANRQAKHPVEEFECKSVLTMLGFKELDTRISVLSGGQKKRVALAKALLIPCDLLILDEPTNHLDNDMISWLEKYLIKMKSALLMVTHDRYFLERITNRILEIDRGNLYTYEGNYTQFLELKQQREEISLAQDRKRKNILRKELEWIRAGVQARGTKSKERIARFHALNSIQDTQVIGNISIDTLTSRLGKKTIEINNLWIGYEDEVLLKDFSYNLKRHDRIGILGANGCGKTTLLNTIAGKLEPLSGSVVIGETVRLGYYEQHDMSDDLNKRVIDYIKETSDAIETTDGILTASQMCEKFLFNGTLQYSPISKLSGGERRRLYLCKVLMSQPNILFLDEPTNDLDIQTLQILEDYLDNFNGAVITVSHDRYFLDRICDQLFVFRNKQIESHIGGYSSYIELEEMNKKVIIKETPVVKTSVVKMTSKEKQELETSESRMEEIQMKIDEIDEKMNHETDFKKIDDYSREREALNEQLEIIMERWMELTEKKQMIEEAINKR